MILYLAAAAVIFHNYWTCISIVIKKRSQSWVFCLMSLRRQDSGDFFRHGIYQSLAVSLVYFRHPNLLNFPNEVVSRRRLQVCDLLFQAKPCIFNNIEIWGVIWPSRENLLPVFLESLAEPLSHLLGALWCWKMEHLYWGIHKGNFSLRILRYTSPVAVCFFGMIHKSLRSFAARHPQIITEEL